jgi:hypothetical protein
MDDTWHATYGTPPVLSFPSGTQATRDRSMPPCASLLVPHEGTQHAILSPAASAGPADSLKRDATGTRLTDRSSLKDNARPLSL